MRSMTLLGPDMSSLLARYAGLALAALPLSCSGGSADRPDGPSVLLVTLDTTRADRLGCYGYGPARTPRIDALAARGVRFERAYCPVPLTLPSHAALMTGVHPRGTGLHVNFQGALPAETITLAEQFRSAGYRTGAFVAAWVLNQDFGLDRGFEFYDDLSARDTRVDQQAERGGQEIADSSLSWLAEAPDDPFFAWVHFFDAHDPYVPPEGFRDLPHPYDGEIAFVDAQLGRILDWLEESGRADDTVIVIAADHGESLGEHGEDTHGLLLYESATRVPLIFAGAPSFARGHVVQEPVGLVDVHPTLVDLLGWDRADSVEGRSLLEALEGGEPAAQPISLESEYGARSFGWAPLHALVSGPWKYIESPAPELYDVVRDRPEATNAAEGEKQRAADMRRALGRFLTSSTVREAGDVDLGAADEASLSALGYVSGVDDLEALPTLEGLRNPRDMTHVMRGMMQAKRTFDDARYAETVELLAPLVEESPESDEMWNVYGESLLKLNRFEEARVALQNALRKMPDNPRRIVALADAQRGLGRPADARAQVERALALDPDYGQGHSRMGVLLGATGDLAGATRHFKRFAELEPNSPNAHCNYANGLLATGHLDDGLRELQAALRIDPACLQAHDAKITVLSTNGRHAEAFEALRAAASATELPRFALQLAWILATSRNTSIASADEALALANRHAEAVGSAFALDVLGAARGASGDTQGAIEATTRALQLVETAGDTTSTAATLGAHLEAYRAGRPWRE
ncbi:MAG: sulfatase-like hydrolase/transferase [bacterium]|nr:sulfatase-like hydrolase/transferase [bacterium]